MANAGYEAKVMRDWDIPQGADTVNAFRYSVRTVDPDPQVPVVIVYPDFETDGWTARAQIRSAAGGEVWVTFLSESVDGPRVALEDGGKVSLVLPHDVTEDEAWNTRYEGYYDLEIIDPSGFVTRMARGTVYVTHDYTRTV